MVTAHLKFITCADNRMNVIMVLKHAAIQRQKPGGQTSLKPKNRAPSKDFEQCKIRPWSVVIRENAGRLGAFKWLLITP